MSAAPPVGRFLEDTPDDRAPLVQMLPSAQIVKAPCLQNVLRLCKSAPPAGRFLEDTLMTEHWATAAGAPCAFRAWLFLPYRRLIPAASLARSTDEAVAPVPG